MKLEKNSSMMNCPLGNHRQKVRLNMKINGITSHNFSSQKQISFGIIEDKTAARIIEENAQNECTLPILNSSKFSIFSSEGQKLKVKLNEEFLRERTTDDVVENIKTSEYLDFENPIATLDDFRSEALALYEYEDTSKPSLRERVKRAEEFYTEFQNKPYTSTADSNKEETEAQVWREAHGFWF